MYIYIFLYNYNIFFLFSQIIIIYNLKFKLKALYLINYSIYLKELYLDFF